METEIIQLDKALGLIIPDELVQAYNLNSGDKVNIELKDHELTIRKEECLRSGWSDAFAAYAAKNAEEKLLPDHFDDETDKHL